MPTLNHLTTILQRPILGNSLRYWLIAIFIAAITFLVFLLLRRIIAQRFAASAKRFDSRWMQIVAHLADRTRNLFLLVLAMYCGSLILELPPKATLIVNTATVLALLLQSALWGHSFVTFAVDDYMRLRLQKDAASATTVTALGFLAKLVLWTLVILLSLDNVGVNVTALIAGLGIGGIAVALAAQNILGDLFASLSIVLDKPFVLGDVIAVNEFVGTVEQIGVKTTRLRSLSGEQLIFANSELLKSTIRNHKRLTDRRVVFTIDVTFETPVDKLAAIPAMIREAIESHQQVRIDRVHFKSIGSSGLVFEAVYFVLSPDYNLFMDIQQAINLGILTRFEREQIEFAYPTQTIHVQGIGGSDCADRGLTTEKPLA